MDYLGTREDWMVFSGFFILFLGDSRLFLNGIEEKVAFHMFYETPEIDVDIVRKQISKFKCFCGIIY